MTVQVATDTGAVVHYQSNHSFVAANFTQVSSGQRLICGHLWTKAHLLPFTAEKLLSKKFWDFCSLLCPRRHRAEALSDDVRLPVCLSRTSGLSREQRVLGRRSNNVSYHKQIMHQHSWLTM